MWANWCFISIYACTISTLMNKLQVPLFDSYPYLLYIHGCSIYFITLMQATCFGGEETGLHKKTKTSMEHYYLDIVKHELHRFLF